MIRAIIFDWKRTLYDPDDKFLIDGALDVLMLLTQKDIPLVLIGKGGSEMYQEVERLGVASFFSEIIFKEGPKNRDVFQPFISKMLPEETVFVGDRVRSEVALGNSLHATTIWVKQGKFAAEKPLDRSQQPTYTVNTLDELKVLLEKNV